MTCHYLLCSSVATFVACHAPAAPVATPLNYEVFVNAPTPAHGTETSPAGETQVFSPIASTLILGASEAVLVDPPMTTVQTDAVADWIAHHHQHLKYIFITHGHGDHWFGTARLLQRFPGAVALASAGTIEIMRLHAEHRAEWWDSAFPGQIPDSPVVATTPPNNKFELEGQSLEIVEVGHSDTEKTSVLHVPALGLVVAGDVVYNGVHQYLVEGRDGGFEGWLKALDIVAALHPRHVVCSHQNKARPDDPRSTIDETRRYLEDARRVTAESHNAQEYYDAMLKLYPDRLNRPALWFWAAKPLFAGNAK